MKRTPNYQSEARSPTNLGDHYRNCASRRGLLLAEDEHRASVPRCSRRGLLRLFVIAPKVAIRLTFKTDKRKAR